jgi:spore germination protein
MLLRGILLYFIALATASAATEPAILAYYASSERGSPAALMAHCHYFNQVATDVFDTDEKGKISGRMRQDDLDFIRSKNMPVYATVSNYGGGDFSPSIAHAIIASPEVTQAFLDAMTQKLAQYHYTGINIDFESLKPEDRAAFTAFVGTVAKKMHDGGYTVVLSVPAIVKDDPDNSWSGAFDLKALGALVDVVQVMTYDQNGPWGSAGPVAGLDWVEQAVQYTASVVSSAKISMGLPAFGYDWDLNDKTKSGQLNWTRVHSLMSEVKAEEQWDDASSSPFFKYTRAGHPHVAWYENEKSLRFKAKLVAKYHLGGVSVWALGMEDDAFWQAVRAELISGNP